MPLEIRELVIRAQVGTSNEQSSAIQTDVQESDTGRITEEALVILEKLEEIRRNRKER